jgi:hypothetical protein
MKHKNKKISEFVNYIASVVAYLGLDRSERIEWWTICMCEMFCLPEHSDWDARVPGRDKNPPLTRLRIVWYNLRNW